ncbi:unnamed protein product [Victoria cruziana]
MAASSSSPTSAAKEFPHLSVLNAANFAPVRLTWSLIPSQDLQGFVNGENLMPDRYVIRGDVREVNPEKSRWRKSNRLLRGWTTGMLSEDVLGVVAGLDITMQE